MSLRSTIICTQNSTTSTLGAGAAFVGTAIDLLSFQEVTVNVAGLPVSAPGTLVFEFSPDKTHWDISVPILLSGPNSVPIPLRVILPYFRIRYENGATPLTEFRLTTLLHREASKHLTRFLSQSVSFTEPVETTRAIVSAQRPDGSFGGALLDGAGALVVGLSTASLAVPVTGSVSVTSTGSLPVTLLSAPQLFVTTTGSVPVMVQGTLPVSMSNSPFVGVSGPVFVTSTGSLPVFVVGTPTVNQGTTPWQTSLSSSLTSPFPVDAFAMVSRTVGYTYTTGNINTITTRVGGRTRVDQYVFSLLGELLAVSSSIS